MDFSDKERAFLEKIYSSIRTRVVEVRANPEKFSLVPGERLHIWKRLEQLENMSREELMSEVEADFLFYHHLFDYLFKFDRWDDLNERAEAVQHQLREYQDTPGLIMLKPGENQYIWDRLNATLALSFEELKNILEADDVLLSD